MNSPIHTNSYASRHAQRGLSLIELMISITLGLLILSSLTALFVNQSRSRAELDKSNRMIDNGRYALEVLSENLRMAGFYDIYVPAGVPAATPEPCNLATLTTSTTNLDVLRHHVQGYNAATVTTAIPITAPLVACGFTAANLKDGSDILVLRRVSTGDPVPVATKVATATYLQVANCATDTVLYEVALGTANFNDKHAKNCTDAASLRLFMVQAYFVSPDNNAGDGIPTLKRRELDPATNTFITTALVEGIEYMQIDYGLDTDSDGAPDNYIAAPATPAEWNQVLSVKINLIARNIDSTIGYSDTKSYELGTAGTFDPFDDAFKRHAYTQVVRLVNPSSRKE